MFSEYSLSWHQPALPNGTIAPVLLGQGAGGVSSSHRSSVVCLPTDRLHTAGIFLVVTILFISLGKTPSPHQRWGRVFLINIFKRIIIRYHIIQIPN